MKRTLSPERYQEIKRNLTPMTPEELYRFTVLAWRQSGFEFNQSFNSFIKDVHAPLYRYEGEDYPEGIIIEGRKNIWNVAQLVNAFIERNGE